MRPSYPVHVVAQNERAVSGFSLVRDIYQQPVFLLEVHNVAQTYHVSKQLLRNALYILSILGGVFLTITLLSLRRWVLSPLFVLLKDVQVITHNSDITNRVRELGKDELGY
ncbi:MAG: hypothetical protein R3E08_04110 [Thiotrichaceae bacterium]